MPIFNTLHFAFFQNSLAGTAVSDLCGQNLAWHHQPILARACVMPLPHRTLRADPTKSGAVTGSTRSTL
jgi:hypothetical protein